MSNLVLLKRSYEPRSYPDVRMNVGKLLNSSNSTASEVRVMRMTTPLRAETDQQQSPSSDHSRHITFHDADELPWRKPLFEARRKTHLIIYTVLWKLAPSKSNLSCLVASRLLATPISTARGASTCLCRPTPKSLLMPTNSTSTADRVVLDADQLHKYRGSSRP